MIALLTDFGTDNHYVAQMKASIYRELPTAVVIDITHSISPQNILEASYVLRDTVEAFPAGALFVVVVDPGVGTKRRILIVESNEQMFVMPDNGLIEIVKRRYGLSRVFSVDTAQYDASFTFHGRDIMAPVAAKIACGQKPESLGNKVDFDQVQGLDIREPECHRGENGRESILGRIVYVDRFGNLISNISSSLLPTNRRNCIVTVGGTELSGIHNTFTDQKSGELLALIGSHNRVEVAVNCGNAMNTLECKPLDEIKVEWSR